MIKMVKDHMLYNRYIIFTNEDGRNLFLIDTQYENHIIGALYLWAMDNPEKYGYDYEDHRLIITGVDEV